jgi:hypothetical protein
MSHDCSDSNSSGVAVLVCKFVFDAFEGEKDESTVPKEECAQAEASEKV